MAVELVSREMEAGRSLMHYRVGGEKKGVRRWQNEDGSYTPAGYKHYSEMYGWGKGPGKKEKMAQDTKGKESEKPSSKGLIERAKDRIEKKHEKNTPETRREAKESDKEAEKKATEKIEKAQKDLQESKERRQLEKTALKDMLKSVRTMSDEELNKQLDRLRREKQFSELVTEREAREKGPLRTMANKLLKDAAEELGRKSLSAAIDTLVNKVKDKADGNTFKLSDYKDVDIFSLSSDKISAISDAFQKASMISQNRWKIEHPGENQNNNQGNQNNNNQNTQNNGDGVSKNQRKRMRSLANSGKSAAEIAKELGVSESTVQKYAGEQLKSARKEEPADESKNSPAAESRDKPAKDSKPTKTSSNPGKIRTAIEQQRAATKSQIERANKFLSSFEKQGLKEASERDKEDRIKRFNEWVNGSEWDKKKAEIRAEEEERRRREEEEKKRKRIRDAYNGLIV